MEEDKNIPEAAKKFTMDTSTDFHFDMLADPTKLKLIPPNLVDKNDVSINDNHVKEEIKSEDSDSDSVSSVKVQEDSESSKKSSVANNSSSDSPKFYSQNDTNKNVSFTKSNSDNNFGQTSTRHEAPQNIQPQVKKEFPTIYNSAGDAGFSNLDANSQRMARMEKYAELISIKRSGITLTKEYNINSDYTEMCFEVDYWTNHQKKKDAVELGKSFLVNSISALEFLNESYDPFGLKLKGWSESVELNKDSYQTVFEELYEKYKMSGRKLEPELKLLFMVSASAASFHASKKMAESMPGLDSVLQNNPDLMAKLQGAINNQISGDAAKEKEKLDKEEQQRKMYEQMKELKAQQKKFEDLQKAQETVDSNTEKIRQQMDMMNNRSKTTKQSNNKQQKADISNILNKIKAQNAAKKADEVINDKLSDSSDEKISLEEKQSEDMSDSYTQTIGSDGKPTRKKRSTKSTISIITN